MVTIVIVLVALFVGGAGMLRWISSQWSTPAPTPDVRCEALVNATTVDLTIEQARNASIIAGIAAQRGLVPRAVSIALATAFQESGIRNLDYGDRDSLGMFQQRPSMGWGTPDQVMDPYYSTGKFFDVMVTVDDWQDSDIGDVAQEVQRSGFPDAYDQHVAQARILASALSGETPAAWSCVVSDPAPADPSHLMDAMDQAYGSSIDTTVIPGTSSTAATMTVVASSEAVAWSAAAFAQSWATSVGVTSVQVGPSRWTASSSVLSGWVATPDAVGAPTVVTITF